LQVAFADLAPGGLPAEVTRAPNAMAVGVDVTDPDAAVAMAAAVTETFGRIDVLVNNAGIAGPTAAVADYPVDQWHRVLEVNLFGVFHCIRACLPGMVERGYGRIVNVASIAGKDPNPQMSAYSSSKAGVRWRRPACSSTAWSPASSARG
jgi:3-oxoacyl-[acyl-carrier protein] reductase